MKKNWHFHGVTNLYHVNYQHFFNFFSGTKSRTTIICTQYCFIIKKIFSSYRFKNTYSKK